MAAKASRQRKGGARLSVLGLSALALVITVLVVFSYSFEAYLKRVTQRHAEAYGLQFTWGHTSLGLGQACLEDLRWLQQASQLHGSARALCVSARWRWAWPPITPEHVSLQAPKLVASLEQLTASGARAQGGRATTKGPTVRRSLSATLPIDLDVSDASLWLTQGGESVASVALQLRWRPLQSDEAQLGQLKGQARLRGVERPYDLKGNVSEGRLELTAPSQPWRLGGPQELSVKGLELSLKERTLTLHGASWSATPLQAQLEVKLTPAQRLIQLSSGSINLSQVRLDLEELSRSLRTLKATLLGLLSPLGLDGLDGLGAGPRLAENHGEAHRAHKAQSTALLPLDRWRVEARGLSISGPTFSDWSSALILHELTLSARGASLSLHDKSGELPKPQLTLCLGEGCQGEQRRGAWELELTRVPLRWLMQHARRLFRGELSIAEGVERVSEHLEGLLSVKASGRALTPRLESIQHLSLTLEGGALRLSGGEPPLPLPTLKVSAPQALTAREVPLSISVSAKSSGEASISGSISLNTQVDNAGEGPELSANFSLSPISCQRALDLIPRQALGPIESLKAKGSLSPTLTLSYQRGHVDFTLKRLLRSCTFTEMSFEPASRQARRVSVAGHRSEERDVLWLLEPFVFEVDPRLTTGARVQVGPGSSSYVRLSELPSYVPGAMYLTEEMGFWTGGAISPTLIKNAINTNLQKGGFVYGGSTITQQLVKNLFLSRDKRLTRKLQEALIGARVIDGVGKERILELYLNCIEFGPGVYGIQEAARYYFQKDARSLSPQESVFLAMLKVSPARGARWKRRGSSPSFTWWRARSVEVFKRLVDKGLLSARQAMGQAPFVLKWSREGNYLGAELLEP